MKTQLRRRPACLLVFLAVFRGASALTDWLLAPERVAKMIRFVSPGCDLHSNLPERIRRLEAMEDSATEK